MAHGDLPDVSDQLFLSSPASSPAYARIPTMNRHGALPFPFPPKQVSPITHEMSSSLMPPSDCLSGLPMASPRASGAATQDDPSMVLVSGVWGPARMTHPGAPPAPPELISGVYVPIEDLLTGKYAIYPGSGFGPAGGQFQGHMNMPPGAPSAGGAAAGSLRSFPWW
jgi:hypothetical protein